MKNVVVVVSMGFSTTKGSKKAFPWDIPVALLAPITMVVFERATEVPKKDPVLELPDVRELLIRDKPASATIVHQGVVTLPAISQLELKALVPSMRYRKASPLKEDTLSAPIRA